jgi:hypothetical protein
MASQASRMSYRYFLLSGRIDLVPRFVDGLSQIWVLHRPALNKVNGADEQVLESGEEAEVGFGMTDRFHGFKLNEEIDVATLRIKRRFGQSRTEYLQASNAETPTQILQVFSVIIESLDHDGLTP